MPNFIYDRIAYVALLPLVAGIAYVLTRRTSLLPVLRVCELVLAFALLIGGLPRIYNQFALTSPSLGLILPGVLLAMHAVTPSLWNARTSDG